MIDHAARRQMADTIRSYLNEEIKSFQLSDALDDIRMQTADNTVNLIVDVLSSYVVFALYLGWGAHLLVLRLIPPPIPLVFQVMPETDSKIRVKVTLQLEGQRL